METNFLGAVCEFISKKLFIVCFGVSTFFEIIFGIPSFVFVIGPFLISSLIESDFRLFFACLYLASIFLFAVSGFIAFILHLIGRNKQFRQRYGDEYWYKLKTYDNFNAMAITLLGFGSVFHAFNGLDAFTPVAKSIYFSQMHGYREHNPNCPYYGDRAKSSIDIFIDDLHEKYMCCGWTSATDWQHKLDEYGERLPFSCCPTIASCEENDMCRLTDGRHYEASCQEPFTKTFLKFDTSTYSTGVFYFLLKAIAYLTYCNSYKEIIEGEPLMANI